MIFQDFSTGWKHDIQEIYDQGQPISNLQSSDIILFP